MDTIATNTTATSTSNPSTDRRRTMLVGAAVTAVAVAGTLWAVLKSGTGDSSQVSTLPYVAAAALVVGVVLFAWLVPSRISARGTGLPFALVSIPLIAVYWSALPLLLAAAGVLIGLEHRAGGAKRGRALAAVVIGSIVGVLTIAAILIG